MITYKLNEIPHLVHGRTSSCREPLTLFWTASALELNVRAGELWVELNADWSTCEPWYSFVINGVYMSRRMAEKGTQRVCVFRGMDPGVVKNVRIIKDTQAMSGDPGCLLQICSVSTDGELLPVEERGMKLEFIGDSITSGEADIGAREEQDWIPMLFSSENNYAVMVGRTLNADIRVISQSGWGIGCAWNNDPNGAIPPIYDEVCGLLGGDRNAKLGVHEKNDFKAWQPDVIFINLGTNDNGSFNQPEWRDAATGASFHNRRNEDGTMNSDDVERLCAKARTFLSKLRQLNPNSRLVWAFGMLGTELSDALKSAVEAYSAESGDTNVDFLPLTDDIEHRGARNHPGVEAHRNAANEIIAYLNSTMK